MTSFLEFTALAIPVGNMMFFGPYRGGLTPTKNMAYCVLG